MAHRGPLRECFTFFALSLFFQKAPKTIKPTHTSFIIDADDEIAVAHNATIPPITMTPPHTTGFLPILFAFIAPLFSDLAEEMVHLAFMYLLTYALPRLTMVTKRFCLMIMWLASRLRELCRAHDRGNDVGASHATRAGEGNDVGSNAIETQPSVAENPNKNPVSPASDQVVADLRAAAAEKGVQIATLTKAAKEKSKTIMDITRRHDSVFGNLRTTLDPNGLYRSTADLVVVAKDFKKDFDRVSRKLERHRLEIAGVQNRDEQISTLSLANTRLVADLKKHKQDAVNEARWAEELAETERKKLRERALEAERVATHETIPIKVYREQLSQIHHLEVSLTNLRKEKADVEEEGNSATHNGEEQASELQVENDRKLGLAHQKIQDAEKKTEAVEKDLESAVHKAEALEKEAEAEKKKVEDMTAEINELRSQLANAQEQKAEDTIAEIDELRSQLANAQEQKAEDTIAEIDELRSQLANAQEQKAEAHHNGYLQAMSENPPSDQSGQASDSDLPEHGREEGNTSQEDDLRRQIDLLTAANNDIQLERANHQADTQNQINKALADERWAAQFTLAEAEEEVRKQGRIQLAGESQRLQGIIRRADLEISRLNEVGSGVEQQLKNTLDDLSAVRQQLTDSQAINAQQTIEIRHLQDGKNDLANPEGDLKEARDIADQLYETGAREWKRAEAAEKRANEAEAKIEKYKEGKEAQDGRIKNLHQEIRTLKSKISPNSELEAAEFDAVVNARFRATNIIEEFVNRHYDFATRNVLIKLMVANDKIDELKVLLKNPRTTLSRDQLRKVLEGADVNKDEYNQLEFAKRQVLIRQCRAVNLKLVALRYIINADERLSRDKLLAEIYNPRGDEEAVWDDEAAESEPESDEDEDDDGNGGNGGSSRPIQPLPSRPRNRLSQQPEGQNTPLPTNPNSDNPLKRKGDPDDNESEGSGKRHDDSDVGMRPIAGAFAQPPLQGSSSPEADVDQSETKAESQDDLPSSERIGEAAAPQIQSNDETNLSPQAPGSPSSSIQTFSTVHTTPDNHSATPSQADHVFHPKPSRIPGPKPTASFTPSERQEGLAIRGHQDAKAASAQGSVPFTTEGSMGFSFSAPKHISSAVVLNPTPAQPNHNRIFQGLSLLGAAMADKDSTVPGLPPPAENEVIDFGSSAVNEDHESDSEPDDEFLAHTVSDDEEEDETVWEDALYPEDRDDGFSINLRAYTSTDNGNDNEPSTVRALDMTEQNYEEQAAEAKAAVQGTQQVPPKEGQPQNEEQEDTFHIDLDSD